MATFPRSPDRVFRSSEIVADVPEETASDAPSFRALFSFRHRSLRTMILLLLTGIIAGLTLLILASVLIISARASERAMRRDFGTVGGFMSQYFEERTHYTTEICRIIGSQPTVIAYLLNRTEQDGEMARQDWNTVSDITEGVRAAMGANRVVLIAKDGTPLGASSATGKPSVACSKIGFENALLGHPWQGLVMENGLPAIAVSVPVLAPSGNYVEGVFYSVSVFDDRLASRLHNALGKEVAFIDRGRIVASSLPITSLPPLSALGASSDDLPAETVFRTDGVRYLANYQRLTLSHRNDTIGVLLLHPYQEAKALASDLRKGLLLSATLTLLLAIFLGSVVSNHLVRPLDAVVAAARQIRFGIWPENLPTDRMDEIGLLQSAFNEMTATVKSAQERLMARIDTDPLTDLDSHRRFKERLTQEIRRSADSGESLALILIDLDGFRTFNDRHSLSAGDEALCQVATTLRALLPPVATIARYGGDEFGVILPPAHPEEVRRTAETIREAVASLAGFPLTVSIGFANYQKGMTEPEPLLLAAEFAVTQAKQQGGDAVFAFDPASISLAPVSSCGEESDRSGAGGMQHGIQHLFHSLRDGSLVAIQALAAAVDAKDPYTEGHSHRVAEFAVLLAEGMGLPAEEVSRIHTAAILHDVGKIGIPDRILQKQTWLDADEIRIMQTHAVMGEIIVAKIPQIARCVPGVRSHHERWDGNGYPDGLQGTEIPVIARIIALADTFDAMTTDRPYQRGRSFEEALAAVNAGAGTQFDPNLVPIFLLVIRTRFADRRAAAPLRRAA